MHGVTSGGKVLQVHDDDIMDLGPQYGAQIAQPDGFGDLLRIRSIRVLLVYRLFVHTANPSRPTLQEYRCIPGP